MLPLDELAEAADLAVMRLVLVEEGEIIVVEDLEELVPGNLLQALFRFVEVDAQDAARPASLDARRMAAARRIAAAKAEESVGT